VPMVRILGDLKSRWTLGNFEILSATYSSDDFKRLRLPTLQTYPTLT
jgi:hypothetical protein